MPVRRSFFPVAGALRMHRRIDYGDLLRVQVLDTRQFRSGQICGAKTLDRRLPLGSTPRPTILGEAQATWLEQGLGGGQCWSLLAQQVMVMPFLYPGMRGAGRTNLDSWSGCAASRERLAAAIQARKLINGVIATGDVHQHHAGVIPNREGAWDSPAVTTEFVSTSISSSGDGVALSDEGVPAGNPHCKLFDTWRGYQLFDISRDVWRTHVKVVDRVTSPGGSLSTIARFAVQPSQPDLSSACVWGRRPACRR